MKLGIYTAVLHDRPLRESLDVIASLGLTGAEINAGGFLPSPHLPVDMLLSGALTPEKYLKPFAETGAISHRCGGTSAAVTHCVNPQYDPPHIATC